MKLQHYLKSNHISRKDFAHHIGVSEGAVNHWINGIRRPDDSMKKRIAEVTFGNVMPNDWVDLSNVYNSA